MEAAESRKRKLDLDCNRLLSKDAGDGEPPPSLVVIKAEPQPLPRKSGARGGCDDHGKEKFWENLTDVDLEEKIQRQERNLECFASKLPDKGKKIRDQLHQLEEEKRRRTFARAKMLADECEKLSQPPSSHTVGKVSRNLGFFFKSFVGVFSELWFPSIQEIMLILRLYCSGVIYP